MAAGRPALLISDPVELAVPALGDVAITVHLPDDLPSSFGITGRYARLTNYISPLGNFADHAVMPVGKIGFMLKPNGFFDRNPALDVPAPVGHHCGAGGADPSSA